MLKYDRRAHTLLQGDQICTKDHTYRITEVRGIGGSGIIYAATRDGSQAQFVLKEFFPAGSFYRRGIKICCSHSKELKQEYAARFCKESDLSAMLHNQSRRIIRMEQLHVTRIVHKDQLYSGRAVQGCLFGLMDDLAGAGSFLTDLWRSYEPMNVSLALNVVLQVLRALDVCHRQGYRHGDLSLGNIYFTEWDQTSAGFACLLDFTLTTRVGADGFDAEPAVDRGTPPFMAPEIRSSELRGLHSDVWSAARLLLLLLTCSSANPDLSDDLIRQEDLRYIGCSEALRQALNRVLAGALEADPLLRRKQYPDAISLYRALEELLPLTRSPRYRLITPRFSTEGFRSREQELQDLETALENGERPVIGGIGGMGKTCLCVKLGQRLKKNYKTYVIPYVPSADFDSMEETLLNLQLEPYVYTPARAGMTQKAMRRQEFQERLEILRSHFTDALFIVDNLRHPSKSPEELLSEPCFLEFRQELDNPILYTTRMDLPSHSRWVLRPMETEQLLELMRYHLQGTYVEERMLLELIAETGGHTLTLVLVASALHAREGLITPEEILERLQTSTLSDHDFADRDHAKIFSHLRTLFDLSALEGPQKEVLRLILLFGEDGLDYELFRRSLNDTQRMALKRLEDTGWINRRGTQTRGLPAQLKTQSNRITAKPLRLHPMIWDMCVEELKDLPPDPSFILRLREEAGKLPLRPETQARLELFFSAQVCQP